MLGNQSQLNGKGNRLIAVHLNLALLEPLRIKALESAELRHTRRSAAVAVNPCVTNFGCHHRQAVFHLKQLGSDFVERCPYDFGIGISLAQIGIDFLHGFVGVRSMVVAGEVD